LPKIIQSFGITEAMDGRSYYRERMWSYGYRRKGALMSDQNQPLGQIDRLLVRVEEAARLLSLSRSMIYEMMNSGELPFIQGSGG
jgi:excisionase family DNA binding protein